MQSNGQLMMVMVQPMCFGAGIACLEEVGIQKDQELSGVTFKIVNLTNAGPIREGVGAGPGSDQRSRA